MKALIKNTTGIYLTEYPLIHDKEVLLKVDAVGLCRTDLLVARNKIKTKNEELVLGHEFSAQVVEDKTNTFSPGQWVGVNPLYNTEFMGLDFNGSLCEYISVPVDKVIATNMKDSRLIAYLEPLAASMAVLKALPKEKNIHLAIVGHNRIAQLTLMILESEGYHVDYLNEKDDFKENYYDYMIETVFEDLIISKMIKALKPEGTFIIKSRKKFPATILASDLVAKEITLKAVNYYDFNVAMRWLENNSHLISPLLGKIYPIENWEQAFEAAEKSEKQKIFIKV